MSLRKIATCTMSDCGRDASCSASRSEPRCSTSKIGDSLTRFDCTRKKAGSLPGGIIAPACFDATWDCASITCGSPNHSSRAACEPGSTWNHVRGKNRRITRQCLQSFSHKQAQETQAAQTQRTKNQAPISIAYCFVVFLCLLWLLCFLWLKRLL